MPAWRRRLPLLGGLLLVALIVAGLWPRPVPVEIATVGRGPLVVTVRVTNTGERGGDDVVQLYGRDVVASVTRPVAQLLGYQRVHLERGQTAVVELVVPAARLAFTDRTGERVVEPGDLDLWVGPSCVERETEARVTLTGDVHRITPADGRWTATVVR